MTKDKGTILKIIKDLYSKIFRSNFAKKIALIAGGTAFAQAMNIIFLPIITRLYPPEEYGILTVYSAALGLLAIAASLDYQKAIPIADDDEKALNLLALSMIVLFLFSCGVTILLYLWGDTLLILLDSGMLAKYKYLIPIGVFLTGSYNIVLQWTLRMRNYKAIAKTQVSQGIWSNLLKVILGAFKIGPIGLILGTILGQSAGITTLSLPILLQKRMVKKISTKDILKLAKRYIKFPLYSAPSNYVYTAGTQIPVIFLTSLFGNSVVGLFGLANSIVRMPMNLIGSSVAQVFYSEAAYVGRSNPEELKRLSIKLIKKLAIIGLVPLALLLFFGPWLFSFVFGSQWYEAGVYARILSIMVYFHFIILPIGRILEIFERQREGLLLNFLRLALIFIVFGVARFMELDSYQTVILYVISTSATYLLLLIFVQIIINDEINKQNKIGPQAASGHELLHR